MSQRYAQWITKWKWPVIIFWLALTVVATLWFPQLKTVVSHQSTTYLPSNSTPMVAGQLANQINPKTKAKSTVLVAIQDKNGLSQTDKQFFHAHLKKVDTGHQKYHVTYVQDTQNVASSVASRFISHDGTTEIATIGLPEDISSPNLPQTLSSLKAAFSGAPSSAHVYFTGDVSIQEDDTQMSLSGAAKTAVVTVALVLIILLIVFRSLVTPFITLLSIGLSYLIGSSVVAIAAEHGLPVSTFTQTFLIAILFGAGTDYSIILLNRFREELIHGQSKSDALASALRGVSKTVMFSSLTVIVSFAVLYFAKFGLYRSAVGVAIGVVITLLVCLTLIPALMSLLGGHLYWPRKPKPSHGHGQSRIWAGTSNLSTRRPWWVLLGLVIVLAPIALLFTDDRSFDPMQDIPNAPSVKGFQAVAGAFGSGQAMPTTVILKTSQNLRSSKGLTTIQNITKSISALGTVKQVDSATQPLGTEEKGFELANQNKQAANGLGQVNSGLGGLASQLKQGSAQSAQAASALGQLQSGSSQVTSGAGSVASGANRLASGLKSVQGGLSQTSAGAKAVSSGNGQVASGAKNLADALSAWIAAHPGEQSDPSMQQILGAAEQLQQASAQTAAASAKVASGIGQVASGLPGLTSGAQSLASGAARLQSGSSQVTSGIGQFQTQMGPMASGLAKAASGASKLQNGVGSVQDYLASTHQAAGAGNPGFYVPSSTISTNSGLKQAMNAYISPNGHVAQWSVVLKQNPYSTQAINEMPSIQQAANAGLAISPISNGTIYLGGTSATQAALNQLSTQDFIRTMVLIFSAIFLLLVLMLRSILAPIYILVSLAATYFVTMGIVQTITVHVLHHPGISWAVPFFVFLLLVALGVDYSIFLMSRYDEAMQSGMGPLDAMRSSMAQMGNVIFSAAAIMMGTFGSLVVTGITTTTEIGFSVIIGLLLYAFVLLAFFVPAASAIMEGAHYWPFRRRAVSAESETDRSRLRLRVD